MYGKGQRTIQFETTRISDAEESHRRSESSLPFASRRQENIDFEFKIDGSNLIITANFQRRTYTCTNSNPRISFDVLIVDLRANPRKFTIEDWNEKTLKIKLNNSHVLQFKSDYFKTAESLEKLERTSLSYKQELDQLKQSIESKLQALTSSHKNEINSLVNKLTQVETQHCQSLITVKSLEDKLNGKTQIIQRLQTELSVFKTEYQQNNEQYSNLFNFSQTQFDSLSTQTKRLISETQFMKLSLVVCSHEEKSNMIKFFNKTIKSINLLYRASDNKFLTSKFHEKCDGIANTLTVIETEFNRKIGGFTPCAWDSPEDNGYGADNLKESFIFSLTNNDKFTLGIREYAVLNGRAWGPTFGIGFDLHVCDNADSQNNSYAKVCRIYDNNNYRYNDVESWKRFTGSSAEQNKFKIKEWEVWEVEWE